MGFGIASVGAITVIAYLVGEAVKTSWIDNKWIPVICGTIGAIIGALGYALKMPNFPANDIITAIAVGIVSGFAATGINQITKQLSKEDKA